MKIKSVSKLNQVVHLYFFTVMQICVLHVYACISENQ